MDNLLTVEQVAEKLQLTPFAVRALLRGKSLRGIKIGKYWRIEESELERFIDSLKEAYELSSGEESGGVDK